VSLTVGEAPRAAPPIIEQPYLLVTHIPHYRDAGGSLWLEPLWHRDFIRHLTYLRRLILASPFNGPPHGKELRRVELPPGTEVEVVPLPMMTSMFQTLVHLPQISRLLWRALGDAEVVHSGVVGWPVPLGWLLNPMAVACKKKLVVVVESAPWRLTGSAQDNWRRRIRAGITETLARWSLNHADLSIFTQEAYRTTLLTRPRGPSLIIPASWIGEENVLSAAQADERWRKKQAPGGTVRFLFAGRLIPDKGVDILLAALARISDPPMPLALDIIGEGPRRPDCERVAATRGLLTIRVLDPVSPTAFLQLLGDYHALLIPSLSDEQPRLLFDAASQAVPVIASDTDGIRPYVRPNETGWLLPRGDASALANAITRGSRELGALERMGKTSLARAITMTHTEMHRARWHALVEQLGAR